MTRTIYQPRWCTGNLPYPKTVVQIPAVLPAPPVVRVLWGVGKSTYKVALVRRQVLWANQFQQALTRYRAIDPKGSLAPEFIIQYLLQYLFSEITTYRDAYCAYADLMLLD